MEYKIVFSHFILYRPYNHYLYFYSTLLIKLSDLSFIYLYPVYLICPLFLDHCGHTLPAFISVFTLLIRYRYTKINKSFFHITLLWLRGIYNKQFHRKVNKVMWISIFKFLFLNCNLLKLYKILNYSLRSKLRSRFISL